MEGLERLLGSPTVSYGHGTAEGRSDRTVSNSKVPDIHLREAGGLYLELGESAIFRAEAVEAAHQDEDEEDHGPTDQSEDLADLVADGSVEGEEHGDEADGCERGADPEAVGSNAADGPEDLR